MGIQNKLSRIFSLILTKLFFNVFNNFRLLEMIQRSSILINDEEYEDIERQLKELQDVNALELSQKKLATNSSIWERTNSQDSAAAFISIGGENVQVKEIKSEPFVPNFLSK